MGQSSSFREMSGKIHKLSRGVQNIPEKTIGASALAAKKIFLASIDPASGGDLKLSGVGKSGGRLGVKYGVVREGDGNVIAYISATGPLQLIERDTKSGVRPRRRRRGRGRSRFIGPIAGYWHPGTKGKHPWERARPAAAAVAPKAFQIALRGEMIKIF